MASRVFSALNDAKSVLIVSSISFLATLKYSANTTFRCCQLLLPKISVRISSVASASAVYKLSRGFSDSKMSQST